MSSRQATPTATATAGGTLQIHCDIGHGSTVKRRAAAPGYYLTCRLAGGRPIPTSHSSMTLIPISIFASSNGPHPPIATDSPQSLPLWSRIQRTHVIESSKHLQSHLTYSSPRWSWDFNTGLCSALPLDFSVSRFLILLSFAASDNSLSLTPSPSC